MKKTILAAIAIAGVAGAFAVPTMVSGNARRTDADGSLAALQQAETPYVAHLSGANEFPGPGDPDGSGAATVSFSQIDGTNTQVCFDLSLTGIGAPTMAHIHTGAAGTAGAVVINFGLPGPLNECVTALNTVVAPILINPALFYVNVHTADFPDGAIRGQLAAGPAPAGATHFLPTPLRSYDSRIAPATKLAAAETRTISLANGKDNANASFVAVPPGATAAIITLTATEAAGPGFVKAYSAASTEPATSNINYVDPGTTVAVTTQVAVDASGSIKLTNGPAATHVIVDVVGYLY